MSGGPHLCCHARVNHARLRRVKTNLGWRSHCNDYVDEHRGRGSWVGGHFRENVEGVDE